MPTPKIKIAIEGYPFKQDVHQGPEVFLKRLSESIKKQGLATQRQTTKSFYDIALFKIRSKSEYDRPFILRVDGIYYDINNTLGDSDIMNSPIFKSIDEASGVVFISEFCKESVEKFHKKILKPNIVIHNAVDIEKFSPTGKDFRKKLNINKNDKVIILSSHWRRHKRLKEGVILFKRLQKIINNMKLLVLGGDPDYVVKDDSIIYAGEIKPNDLPRWYRTGDLYLHLAWIEPCGNTQIEAMACGLPVVCTNNGGIGETVIRANGGIVSQADEEFKFNKIDYYNPPEPNYEILINDIVKIFQDYDNYKNNIDYKKLDINYAARKYIDFMKQVYNICKE